MDSLANTTHNLTRETLTMGPMTSTHALGRMAERLTPEDRQRVTDALANVHPEQFKRDVAVRVARLSSPIGDAWGEESNGSDVWAVIRGGRVATVMLRRKQQPANPRAFGVERVVIAS